MRLYSCVPEGGAPRAVIVIQEAFGVNDHIEDVTRRFADAGYHAVAPALFHRAGGGTAPYDDFEKVLPLFEGLTDPGILMDVDAALAHLARAGVRRWRDRHRRLLHGRPGDVPGVPRARPRRGGRVLRRRHRHRPVPAVPAAHRPSRRAEDAVARAVRRPGRVHPGRGRRAPALAARRASTSRPRSCATPPPTTASTATCGRATTPRPPPTPGRARSPGSPSTSADGRGSSWRRSTTSSSSGSVGSTCSSWPPRRRRVATSTCRRRGTTRCASSTRRRWRTSI